MRKSYEVGADDLAEYEIIFSTNNADISRKIKSQNKALHGRKHSVSLDINGYSGIFLKRIEEVVTL